jgi:hypothetical protein
MLEAFFFVKSRQHPADLTTSIIIHPDPSSKILSTHLLLRSLLEYCICNASTHFPTHHICVSGCARTANVWSETNVAVTQHPSPRFPRHCVESQRPPAISFCGALRRISRRMQGLYGGGILLLHTRCSAQTLVAKAMEEEEKSMCAACIVVVML